MGWVEEIVAGASQGLSIRKLKQLSINIKCKYKRRKIKSSESLDVVVGMGFKETQQNM